MIQDKGVVKGFYKEKLMIWLIVVLVLLCSCIAYDYAENNTITNIESRENIIAENNITILNNTTVINVNESANNIILKSSDKIYTKHSTIGMYAKPSCGCRYSYRWHYREFINYCPNCGHYGTLRKNPKHVPEKEYTCHRCSSDFCGCCGKEKYSWSRVYLRRA